MPRLQSESGWMSRVWPARNGRRGVVSIALTAVLVGALVGVTRAAPLADNGTQPAAATRVVLAFQTMIGNSGPYVGTQGTLRNIPADFAPWKIGPSSGVLTANGQLALAIHGLTLLNGFNPFSSFEGVVSCQSIDSTGHANVVNVSTPAFPATPSGNSTISATVTLPSPCFAPIIFVTTPAPQVWFAATGM